MLKREWDAESNGKLSHIFIFSKTAALVPKFSVEDLPLGRTAALVPEFAVKDLPLCRTLMMMIGIINLGSSSTRFGFYDALTSQVNSVAFYNEREKSDKFCSEALILA